MKALAPKHPEWTTQAPFSAAISNDLGALASGGERALADLVMATHAGMTSAEFEQTTSGPDVRLGVVVHHDDANREVAYDRHSAIGRLDRGLNEASNRNWVVVSMKDDWKQVFSLPK